jgi:choline kinase
MLDDNRRIQIKVDYPNFAGKVIVNEMKLKVEIAGNRVLVYSTEDKINDITKRLTKYNISIFGIEIVSKTLEEMFIEIINNKSNGLTSIV